MRHLNNAAEALFKRHESITYRNGALRFKTPALDAAFRTALRRAACEDGRSSAIDIRLSAVDAGELLVAPLEAGSAPGAPAEPMAIVLFATSPADERAIAMRLQGAYRLTPAEARVAALLAMGQSLEEIAAANEVSYATVRSQVRSILAKTGVRRQADIVRIALTGALLRRDR
jgi:DNA-binding CsgD family transcriptional regulator